MGVGGMLWGGGWGDAKCSTKFPFAIMPIKVDRNGE